MSIRVQHEYLLGRLALAGNRAPKDVERHARTLAKFDHPVARVWAGLLRAGAAIRAGHKDRAVTLLESAHDGAVAAGMKLTAVATRFRLAELRGDDPLLSCASASAEMTPLGVRVPAKMTALLIPTGVR